MDLCVRIRSLTALKSGFMNGMQAAIIPRLISNLSEVSVHAESINFSGSHIRAKAFPTPTPLEQECNQQFKDPSSKSFYSQVMSSDVISQDNAVRTIVIPAVLKHFSPRTVSHAVRTVHYAKSHQKT